MPTEGRGPRAGATLRARVLHAPSPGVVEATSDAVVEVGADGRLVRVAPWRPGDAGPHVVDVREGLLTPGFVDAHVHLPQTGIIGSASGPLLPWLETTTFPAELALRDPDAAAAMARRFADALLEAGTTLALVWGIPDTAATEAALRVLDDAGLQGIIGPVLMDTRAPPGLCTPADDALEGLDALAGRWHDPDGRWQVAALPRFALSCSPALLAGAAALADARQLWVSTHLAENLDEIAATVRAHGCTDLQALDRAGLVRPGAVLAHCVHLDERGWGRLADAGAVVAHCPDANAFLGSGGMPLRPLDPDGPPLALGTDVGAGRSFHLPRIIQMAHDNALRQGRRVSPGSWLHHATAGGAAALGRPDTGTLTPGAWADLVLHDVPDGPVERQLADLTLRGDGPRVRRVWVRGRVVYDQSSAEASSATTPGSLSRRNEKTM